MSLNEQLAHLGPSNADLQFAGGDLADFGCC